MAKKKPEAPKKRRKYENAALISPLNSCAVTGFSPALTYKLIHAGKLGGALKIGRRWWVHVGKLHQWLDEFGRSAA